MTAWSTSKLLTLVPMLKGFPAAAVCEGSNTKQYVCITGIHPCFMLLLHQYETMASGTVPLTHVRCVKTAECGAACIAKACVPCSSVPCCISACNMHYMHISVMLQDS